MRFKLSTAAAAAMALLGTAALNTPAMAANVIDSEQTLSVGSTYLAPTGGKNGFAVQTGNVYFINFTVPAFDTLLNISTYIVHNIPGIGLASDFTVDTYNLYKGTATACGPNVCGVGGEVIPTQTLSGINAKIYDLDPATPTDFVLEVTPAAQGALQGNIQLGSVPEPATWAMMILGIGMIGFAVRRRRGAVALALA